MFVTVLPAEWSVGDKTYSQKTQVVVKDTQTGADAQVVNDGVSTATKSTVKDLAENTLKVVLGDTTYVNDGKSGNQTLTITKVEGNTISASGDITDVRDLASGAEVNISKITFTAKTSSGVSYDYTVSVGSDFILRNGKFTDFKYISVISDPFLYLKKRLPESNLFLTNLIICLLLFFLQIQYNRKIHHWMF